ncbi:MAG: hypothetical protein QNJ54_05500 [Prochloraceae cyanobacterium]|nr:hypothetical protein [Prochloraceae cyanobacterium]
MQQNLGQGILDIPSVIATWKRYGRKGLGVDHTTIYGWVQRYSPELDI